MADITNQIEQCEQRLREAMLQSDVSALDDLLAPDLVFTNHLGFTMSKQDDLDAHRSGVLKINQIDLSDQKIKVLQDSAVVTVQAHIIGSFNGETSENDFRFTRVWAKASDDHWQIVVGHSCLVA